MSRKVHVLLAAALVLLVAAPSFAVTDRWAAWSPPAGSSNDFRLQMAQRSPGFPAATVATDSRAPIQVPSGASAALGAATPPGAKYGTSAGNPYLVLRPKADAPTAPSTTTYAFDAPTPDTGWAFVLGDIDADQVQVAATDATGAPVPAAEVATWFRGTFNYAGGADRPTWDAATSTLTGNPGAVDTDGASGWFEPDIRITSLTMTFTRRAGFPVYQTWFVSRARPVGGTVTDISTVGTCPATGTSLSLLSPTGDVLATTVPATDGTYTFGELATQAGYVVRLDVPGGCIVRGPAQQEVSNRGNDNDDDSRADFDVRAFVPQLISGTVRDETTRLPVAGVTVTLDGPNGPATTTTDADGAYFFDDNDAGPGYTVTIDVPDGYVPGPDGTEIPGITVVDQPIGAQDFTVVDLPGVSGTVTGDGDGVGGVRVVLTPAGGGTPYTTLTAGDGTYEVDDLPPGDYVIDVDPPNGWSAPAPRPVTVPATGLAGQDVDLTRLGAVGGTVTLDGVPAPGVSIIVDGPGGPRTLRTDGEGQYFLDDLAPGTYSIVLAAPAGTTAAGAATRTITITGAGEVRDGQDFALTTVAPVVTTPPPTPAAPQVDLALRKRVVTPSRVTAGETVRYRLRVRNRGTGASTGRVTLVDRLPEGLRLVSAEGRKWRCTTRGARTATCVTKASVRPGTKAPAVVVVARVDGSATGRIVNVARVRVPGESARADNRDRAGVTVVPPRLPSTGFRRAVGP